MNRTKKAEPKLHFYVLPWTKTVRQIATMPLCAGIDGGYRCGLLTGKAYDTDNILAQAAASLMAVVIPPKANRLWFHNNENPPEHHSDGYSIADNVSLNLCSKTFGHFVPVHDFPETFQVVRSAVAVIDIVGMFPYVASQ